MQFFENFLVRELEVCEVSSTNRFLKLKVSDYVKNESYFFLPEDKMNAAAGGDVVILHRAPAKPHVDRFHY